MLDKPKPTPIAGLSDRRVSRGVERARKVAPDHSAQSCFVIEHEPSRINDEDFRAFIMSCVMSGATDITIQTDMQPRGEINQEHYRMTRKAWSPSEVDMVLTEVYGAANGRTEINAQRILDFSYELNLSDGERQRFRVNAVGIHGRDGSSVEITMRALPSKTPTLQMVRLTEAELKAMMPRNGIVIVAGSTGSGKSTTLAAVMRAHLENKAKSRKIVDIQAPIEFTYRDVTGGLDGSASIIGQSEVGRHVPSFAAGLHSALRRKPNIISVGEARDIETIQAAILAAQTGHLVYTTTHANDVSDTIRRMLAEFPGAERQARAFDLISALRFVMVQYLLKREDAAGGVVPVREYLKITPRVKERLVRVHPDEWPAIVNDEVHGIAEGLTDTDMHQSLIDVVKPLYDDGVISYDDAFALGGLDAVAVPRSGGG